jgi:hypothetical protein
MPDQPQATDEGFEISVGLVRRIALVCLDAGRKRADSIVGEDGNLIGFQDWAEQKYRKLWKIWNVG